MSIEDPPVGERKAENRSPTSAGIDTLKRILADAKTHSDLADRTTFTIASGALALSITFRGDIAPADAESVWMLKTAWVALMLSIVGYIHGHVHNASKALDRLHKMLDEYDQTPTPGMSRRSTKVAELRNKFTGVLLGALQTLGFEAGILFLLLFAMRNT